MPHYRRIKDAMKRGQNAAKEETLAAVGNTLVDDFSGGFPGGPDGQRWSESCLSGVARALPLDAGAAVKIQRARGQVNQPDLNMDLGHTVGGDIVLIVQRR